MGIDDKAVTVDPPSDAFGFPSAAAIAVNVRAARITGQITWSTSSWEAESKVLRQLTFFQRSTPAMAAPRFPSSTTFKTS